MIRARIIITGHPEAETAARLLDAGDPRGAARLLEHTGGHASAALLRLDQAALLTSHLNRIAMLRDACARNSGATEEGRALHRALGDALLHQIEVVEDGAPRRALIIEAARAFELAEEDSQAGELYERLGLWRRAAAAYERAGAITRLEYVLDLIERQEAAEALVTGALRAIDDALRLGHRRLAHSLLLEHSRARALSSGDHDGVGRLALSQRLAALEAALPRPGRLSLVWGAEQTTVIHGGDRLRIGRAPDIELSLSAPGISREHVILRLAPRLPPAPPGLGLFAVDTGARAGTFWEGEPLTPGEPHLLEHPGELGIGVGVGVRVDPLPGGGAVYGALLQPLTTPNKHHLFLPGGGPLMLAPDRAIALTLRFTPPYIELSADADLRLRLAGTPLAPGAQIEPLIGDRLELLPQGGPALSLTILP